MDEACPSLVGHKFLSSGGSESPFSSGYLGLCLVPIYPFALPASGNRDLEICGRRYIQRSLHLLQTDALSCLVSFTE
jgi:hypothetical protein